MRAIVCNGTGHAHRWAISAVILIAMLFGAEKAWGQGTFTVNSVTASPTAVNATAAFSIIATYTAPGGKPQPTLEAGDEVTIQFATGVVLPSSISASSILIDGTPVRESPAPGVDGQTITVVSDVTVPRNTAFTTNISESAGVRNPTSQGPYSVTLTVTAGTASNNYEVTSATSTVTQASVTPSPSVAGASAAYTISFNVGESGFLAAGQGTISITFPATTTIPASISNLTVNGTTANASRSGQTVIITTPVTIQNNGAVNVVFGSAAGLKNPTSAGTYTVDVNTSVETTVVTSDEYVISDAGSLSVTAVGVSAPTVNTVTQYTFEFVVSTGGALDAEDSDTFIITFPENTAVPSTIPTSGVTVSSGGFSGNAAAVSVSGRVVTITTPVDVAGGASVSVVFTTGAGIANPSNPGNYTIDLETSKDTDAVSSNPYTINASSSTVSAATVTPSPITPSAASQYTISFTTGSAGRLWAGNSQIIITFPIGTAIGTAVSGTPGNTTVNGTAASSVSVSGQVVTITVPAGVSPIGNSSNVTVVFANATNMISNPTTGKYTLQVKTSPEPGNTSSQSYSISTTSPVSLSNLNVGATTVNATSTFSVTIGGAAALWTRDGDFIRVIFPEGTVIPTSIANGEVTIGGQAVSSVSTEQNPPRVTVFVANNNGTPNSISFTPGAGIRQPPIPSSAYKLQVVTSQNPANATIDYPVAIAADAARSVSAGTATALPSVVSATNVAFEVPFTTSADGRIAGGLSAGSSDIWLEFDANITVPENISAANVQVAGTTASDVEVVTSGAGGEVRIGVPSGVDIGNSTATNVQFSANAGLATGASTTGSITVKTTGDGAGDAAGYTLNAQQELTVIERTVNPLTQNAPASFTIKFTTGTSDEVDKDAGDEIRITFPVNSFIPGTISKDEVKVNNISPATNPVVNQTNRTLTIVSPVSAETLTEVTVQISSNAGILNPVTTGAKTLLVWTTQDGVDRASPSYTVEATTTTVSAASVTTSPAQQTTAAEYTVSFSTGGSGRLLAGTSTITITFPGATVIGSAVSGTPGNTTVNGTAASTVSVSGSAVTITVPSGVSIGNNASVNVVFANVANMLTNPSAGSYTVSVRTSVETSDVTSNSYSISATTTTIDVGAVTLSESAVRRISQYTIAVTPNSPVAEDGTVTIQFPEGTVVPNGTLTASHVTIGVNNSKAVSGNSSTRRLVITIGATPLPGDGVTATNIVISADLGLKNPRTDGSYTLTAWTSVEPNPATSNAYTIAAATSSVTDVSVSADPLDKNIAVEWTWTFTTSEFGALYANQDDITLEYPADTGIPAEIATTRITVNGAQPNAVVTSQDPKSVKITVGGYIDESTVVTVVIQQAANIIGADTYASLGYKVSTDADPTQATTDYSLPVEMAELSAELRNGRVLLSWRTESEVENLGFHIWRSESSDGPFERVSTEMIPGLGTSPFGKEYTWMDAVPPAPGVYFYKIQDVAWDGRTEMHGPIEVTVAPHEVLQFALDQNAPNPFNPTTTVRFTIAERGEVGLVIYSATGQVIRTLVQGTHDAGHHTVIWDGTDNAGRAVASGVYVYRLTSGENVAMRRLTLVR